LEDWARAGLFDLQRVVFGFPPKPIFTIMNGHIAGNPASEFHLDERGD
jgi:hypothetical protein